MDVFSLNFSESTALNFIQLNFWIFFLLVMGVYSVIESTEKQKKIAFYSLLFLGLLTFQYRDTAIFFAALILGFGLYSEQAISKRNKFIALAIVGISTVGFYIFRFKQGNFSFSISVLDTWLLAIAAMFLLARLRNKVWVRSFFLTAVSLFFYYKSSGFFVLLLGLSLVINFWVGQQMDRAHSFRSKKLILIAGILFNVIVLVYFKYAYFFTEAYNSMFQTDFEVINYFGHWANGFFGAGSFTTKILLPVGVSFFTFQSISYVVDIYRKEVAPVKSFFDYSFFVTFFPQLVAGPIVRAKDFIPQIHKPYYLDQSDFSWAIVQVVKGLVKKIVFADYIAVHFIDHVADSPESYPGFVSVLAMWGYSLQIYGDFSGYTDIAIGLSKLMGFQLHKNFNSPYKAKNVADFWRRWHISLSTWLRDYLYIPLGGNRRGGVGTYLVSTVIFVFLIFITQWYALIFVYLGMLILYAYGAMFIQNFNKLVHRDLNLLVTMIIGGLWHGASRNFVIWGAMNASALVLYKYWKVISPYEKSTSRLSLFWKVFLTFNFITFTRIWFRLEEDTQPMVMLHHMVNHFDFSATLFGQVIMNYWSVFLFILIGFTLHWLPTEWKKKIERQFEKMNLVLKVMVVSLVLFGVYQAAVDGGKPFVYFQF